MGSKFDSESLYGSSFFPGGNHDNDADMPKYVQLYRRLFHDIVAPDGYETVEPEEEENIARYFKYFTGMPLSSLRMEPALLESDIQRVSKELTMVLLNETSESGTPEQKDMHPQTPTSTNASPSTNSQKENTGDGEGQLFKVVCSVQKTSEAVSKTLGESVGKVQQILPRLEEVCSSFTSTASRLDSRSQTTQCVLDKQDLISRMIELPRIMQMCIASGYYEEAVDIAEHVRVTGNRLVQDIKEDMLNLNKEKDPNVDHHVVDLVEAIQKQVQAEFDGMVVYLCHELAYQTTSLGIAGKKRPNGDLCDSNKSMSSSEVNLSKDGTRIGMLSGASYEKSMKRLSAVAKVIAILRNIEIYSEDELSMLYLRSRWQAWVSTADSLSVLMPEVSDRLSSGQDIFPIELSQLFSSEELANPNYTQCGPVNDITPGELSTFLTKYIDAFCTWLLEVDMQYRTFFASSIVENKGNIKGDTDTSQAIHKRFTDLALFSSQKTLEMVRPLIGLVNEASTISDLMSLTSFHGRALSNSNIDFLTPFLIPILHERAFISIVGEMERSVSNACHEMDKLALSDRQGNSISSRGAWGRLAVPTRPSLAYLGLQKSINIDDDPIKFISQFRVSPIGLLQYPILATLHHSFRDALHALRIFVMADDPASIKKDHSNGPGNALVLLNMTAIVIEGELTNLANSLASLCTNVLGNQSDQQNGESAGYPEYAEGSVSDLCIAFVFGLVRNIAETFEEIASLNEQAMLADCSGSEGAVLAMLFSSSIYQKLLPYLDSVNQIMG